MNEFAGDVLDKKGIAHIGNEIKSLSSAVPVIYNPEIYQRTKGFSPGAVFIFEVEVTFENGKLKVTEKVVVLGVFCHSYLKLCIIDIKVTSTSSWTTAYYVAYADKKMIYKNVIGMQILPLPVG